MSMTHAVWPTQKAPAYGPLRRSPFLLALLAIGCGDIFDDPGRTVPDPAGTRTTTINFTIQPHPIVLFQGTAADGPYVICPDCRPPGQHPFVQVLTGIDRSLNVHFTTVTSLASDFREYYLINEYQGGEVVALGRVAGLGAITSIPNAGWGPLASAAPGHGYVLRFKPARNFAANLPVIHARMYVVDWLTSTTGGIIGARVEYQFPL